MNLSRSQPYLGTFVEISIDADLSFDDLAVLSKIGFASIESIHEKMSFHEESSELNQINQSGHQRSLNISEELATVLSFCLELSKHTRGQFDITIAPHLVKSGILPPTFPLPEASATWKDIKLRNKQITFARPLLIDLGGVAKGFAVDQALSSILDACPEAKVAINAGGDLRLSHWQSEIAHIITGSQNTSIHATPMLAASLATTSYLYSDTSTKSGHIINPNSGNPAPLSGSVSVFAPSCMHADALTKIYTIDPDNTIASHYHAHVLALD